MGSSCIWYHVLNRRGLALFQSRFRLASVDGTITIACVVSGRHFCPCNPASTPHWTWIKTRCRKANEESVTGTKAPPTPLTCTLIYLSGVGKLTFSLCCFSFFCVFFPLPFFFWVQLELKQNTLLNQDGFDKARGSVIKRSWFSKCLFNKNKDLGWICTCRFIYSLCTYMTGSWFSTPCPVSSLMFQSPEVEMINIS